MIMLRCKGDDINGYNEEPATCISYRIKDDEMINVKEASQKAIEHLKSLFPDQDLGNILLEEAELTEDNKFWMISVSFKKINPAGIVGESVFADNRSFKVFKLHADTGDVRSMKSR